LRKLSGDLAKMEVAGITTFTLYLLFVDFNLDSMVGWGDLGLNTNL
jgi:hypothetical protein